MPPQLAQLPGSAYVLVKRTLRAVIMLILRPLFGSHGSHFRFDPFGDYSYANVHVGSDVYIGEGACMRASRSRIMIGNKVMFGPRVVIVAGNHRSDLVGRYMYDIRNDEKRPEDDRGVIIHDDVWIGAQAMILDGVTIGRGAVIAAGAVVTRDVPAYGVAVGVPAKVVRFRWDPETIIVHELALYGKHLNASER